MQPTRNLTYHNFPGFTVVKVYSDKNFLWKFRMTTEDISVGAYYRGRMVITEAADPTIIGTVFTGFFDLINNPKLNTLGSWMHCLVEDNMDWFCVHSDDQSIKGIAFASTKDGLTVESNTDVVVIEGTLSDGRGELTHIPYKDNSYSLYGDANIFLLYR